MLRILWNGKLVLTTTQAAERYGLAPSSMRGALTRLGLDPIPEGFDAKTPLYLAKDLDAAMRDRPGKGRKTPPPVVGRRRTGG
jgi:hypothetical protein